MKREARVLWLGSEREVEEEAPGAALPAAAFSDFSYEFGPEAAAAAVFFPQ